MHLIAGIDEAGRGCLIGPMALCGVMIEKRREEELWSIGVKDSKWLTPSKREYLYELIHKTALSVQVILVCPQEIDQENLNVLSKKKSAELINLLDPDCIYLDVPARGGGIQKYCQAVRWLVGKEHIEIRGENKADQNYAVVAAASIVAKVVRDREIHALRKMYGDFGSGYPSDPKTIHFARQCLAAHKPLPPIIRTKWSTISRVRSPQQQRLFSEGNDGSDRTDRSEKR
ncbi:MAG: ribonuclease HII [bacterium]